MNRIERIKAKIDQMGKLLIEVKDELETLGKESPSLPKKIRKEEPLPPQEHLQAEYGRLYKEFMANNANGIKDFIKSKSKAYLKAFCKTNNLPLDTTKVSKDKIADEVIQWMAQRKAITMKAM